MTGPSKAWSLHETARFNHVSGRRNGRVAIRTIILITKKDFVFIDPTTVFDEVRLNSRLERPTRWLRAQSIRTSEIIQEYAGILEIREVETFGEPVVDGLEKLTGFSTFALIAPEAREARGGA